MSKSQIFYTDKYKEIEKAIAKLLNAQPDFLSTRTAASTRASGDAIQIESLAWECLTIGALGWGQIQIANANIINIAEGYSRKKWMLELCDVMLEFYPREIGKIKDRIDYFKGSSN